MHYGQNSQDHEEKAQQIDLYTSQFDQKMVKSLKDPIKLGSHKGVYSIPCSCGKVYIGETCRSIEVRCKEHSTDLNMTGIRSHH